MLASRDGRVVETRRLLQILAHREVDDLEWPPAATWDWRNFAEACDRHQVTPNIYCKLQGITPTVVPPGLLEHLRTRFQESCVHNYRLAKKLIDLTSMLENEGVPVLALKGPSLAMAVYGGLSLRQCLDLDLMIRKEQLVTGVRLMKAWGFQATPTPAMPQIRPYLCRPENPQHVEWASEIELLSPDDTFYVDLHWQLGDPFWRPFSPDVDKFWVRAKRQDLPLGSVLMPCREDLFLALSAHGTRHRWFYLKWLLDIAELLRNAGTLDWSRIEEMARTCPGASASANVAVNLARDLLDVRIPAELERILPATARTVALASAIREELLSRGQTSGDEHSTLLALEDRKVARITYHAVRIFRYPESLIRQLIVEVDPKDRALVTLPQRLQFLYHVIRPVRLAVKHCMRVARMLFSMAA